MLEITAILTLIVLGFAAFALLAFVGLILKVAFKLVLLPFVVVGWLLKGLLFVLALVAVAVLAPVLILALGGLAVVAIPLLLLAALAALAGLLGTGWALA